jgi:hypothetical protein
MGAATDLGPVCVMSGSRIRGRDLTVEPAAWNSTTSQPTDGSSSINSVMVGWYTFVLAPGLFDEPAGVRAEEHHPQRVKKCRPGAKGTDVGTVPPSVPTRYLDLYISGQISPDRHGQAVAETTHLEATTP